MGTGTSQIPPDTGAGGFDYNGYRVIDSNQSFQPSSLSNGSVAAYIAVNQDMGYGLAFHVNGLALAIHGVRFDKAGLAKAAKNVIRARIDSGDLKDREEYTYEYKLDQEPAAFVEVFTPKWWIKSS